MMDDKSEKDSWVSPSIRKPVFDILKPEEADEIRGGADWGVGVCLGIGFACYAAGDFGVGFCFGAGYSTGPTPPAPAPPAAPPPTLPAGGSATPTPATPPTPPPAPSIPNMIFVTAPTQVKAGTRTRFVYSADFTGFPYRRANTRFEIIVPGQAGYMTALKGQGGHVWQPADGMLVAEEDTAAFDFLPDYKTGQIMVEIIVDYVTPAGQPPDCELRVTDRISGATISAWFIGVP
jgi:hypothetical protein